jgi:hypothetical protein
MLSTLDSNKYKEAERQRIKVKKYKRLTTEKTTKSADLSL